MQNHHWFWTVLPWQVKFKALNVQSGFSWCQGLPEANSLVTLQYAESNSLDSDMKAQILGSLPGTQHELCAGGRFLISDVHPGC